SLNRRAPARRARPAVHAHRARSHSSAPRSVRVALAQPTAGLLRLRHLHRIVPDQTWGRRSPAGPPGAGRGRARVSPGRGGRAGVLRRPLAARAPRATPGHAGARGCPPVLGALLALVRAPDLPLSDRAPVPPICSRLCGPTGADTQAVP